MRYICDDYCFTFATYLQFFTIQYSEIKKENNKQ